MQPTTIAVTMKMPSIPLPIIPRVSTVVTSAAVSTTDIKTLFISSSPFYYAKKLRIIPPAITDAI